METNIYTKLYNVKKAGIKLQRDTKAFNYKYATLDQIQTKLGDILEEQKLVIIHRIKNNVVITTIFDIESQTEVSSEIEMTQVKAQDKGSEITYFRRYNLLSLLDLEVEDDDGKKAQESKVEKKQEQSPKCEKCGTIKLWSEKNSRWYCKPCAEKWKAEQENNNK